MYGSVSSWFADIALWSTLKIVSAPQVSAHMKTGLKVLSFVFFNLSAQLAIWSYKKRHLPLVQRNLRFKSSIFADSLQAITSPMVHGEHMQEE